MASEKAMKSSEIFVEEEDTLKNVYSSFDNTIAEQTADYIAAKNYALSGNYEAQDTFIHYGAASRTEKRQFDTARLISSLKDSPYFAHILIKDVHSKERIHCLMSDSESLDETINIKAKDQTMIIPFKQDIGREIFNQLFHLYQDKSGKAFTADTYTYQPLFIRNDDIFEQQLQNAVQLFPAVEIKDEEIVDCDELLSRKLKENRSNTSLSNIIATLQRQQYRIIQTDADLSFIVQGCAGSGKSQCLIHRLFYLRDVFAREWDKVLLITPTQLFRNYSADLMRRYRLTGINNTSIADFYRDILDRTDPRFKNRQYKFELSEEYLPDEYLNQVYSDSNISKIQHEITLAIRKHVNLACELIGIENNASINKQFLDTLTEKLREEIAAFDRRSVSASDEELDKARDKITALNEEISSYRETLNQLDDRLQELNNKKDQFNRICSELDSANRDKDEWLSGLSLEISSLKKDIQRLSESIDSSDTFITALPFLYEYSNLLYAYLDYFTDAGEKKKKNDDYQVFLDDYISLCKGELDQFTGGRTKTEWLTEYEKERNSINRQLTENKVRLADAEGELEALTEWLTQHMEDDAHRHQDLQLRANLEREYYYLSRIENSVFEQEIWNALVPLKEKCMIKTLEISRANNGRNKETRILYKSDLMFYLYIYLVLDEIRNIPEYKLICIDEGQDLHKADYELIKKLYPTANLNIFGDLAQSLHEKCGISDWKAETGIDLLFTLDRNYRNPSAIVDFCNRQFGENMKYCGAIAEDKSVNMIPLSPSAILNIIRRTKVTIIVRDKSAFDHLVSIIRSGCRLNYIDTESIGEKEDMISCYSIYAAKGLEFQNVIVYPEGMNHNQKVVACTRAMEELFYINSDEEEST